VFLDESSVKEYLCRNYGYAFPGTKIIGEISGYNFKKTNLIGAYVNGTIIAGATYEHNIDTNFVEAWIEQSLIKELKEGQIVVLDNATFHKSEKIKTLIESVGCKMIFLPPYSPDLNPIEKVWANLKKFLRKNIKRFKSLWEAIVSYFENNHRCNTSNIG
jgi:transposase